MSKKFYNLDKYKTDISLPDFLKEAYGWVVAEGSTNRQPKLKSPAGDVQLVIKMNQKGHYTCWNTYETDPFYKENKSSVTNDKKLKPGSSIIDVVQWEHQRRTGKLLSITEVAAYLEKYLRDDKVISQNSTFALEKELITDEIAFTKLRSETLPLTDTSYLEKRGISPEVLKNKDWEGVFCNLKFYSAAARQTYINTATRLVNNKGTVGMSIRMDNGQKRIEGNRLDALSSSRFDKSRPIDKLHVFESMIDAVSFYQMNYYPDKGDKNVQLVSTEGTITAPQINTIQEIIERNKVKLVELNLDNDLFGLIYTANIVGSITINDNKSELDYFRVTKSGKDEDSILCIDTKIITNNKDKSLEVFQRYFPDDIFNKYIDPDKWNVTVINDSHNNSVYRILLPEHKEVLHELCNNIINLKFNNILDINLPKDKDFNQDLNNAINKQKIDNTLNLEI